MNIFEIMSKAKRHGFWGSLVRTNTGVSSLNFFLISVTLVGVALLVTAIFSIIWEVVHNNIVQSDLSGWATFIGAVGTLFASGGIAKGWSNWSEHKFGKNATKNGEEDTVPVEEGVAPDGDC